MHFTSAILILVLFCSCRELIDQVYVIQYCCDGVVGAACCERVVARVVLISRGRCCLRPLLVQSGGLDTTLLI